MPKLILYRTPIVTRDPNGRGSARLLLVCVHDGKAWSRMLPAIENADDPDRMCSGECTLVMARMATSGAVALWLPGTQLFGHAANYPDELKGCWAPGTVANVGSVAASRTGIAYILRRLGGFREGRQVPTSIIELEGRDVLVG